jgi:hypothetical protein
MGGHFGTIMTEKRQFVFTRSGVPGEMRGAGQLDRLKVPNEPLMETKIVIFVFCQISLDPNF